MMLKSYAYWSRIAKIRVKHITLIVVVSIASYFLIAWDYMLVDGLQSTMAVVPLPIIGLILTGVNMIVAQPPAEVQKRLTQLKLTGSHFQHATLLNTTFFLSLLGASILITINMPDWLKEILQAVCFSCFIVSAYGVVRWGKWTINIIHECMEQMHKN